MMTKLLTAVGAMLAVGVAVTGAGMLGIKGDGAGRRILAPEPTERTGRARRASPFDPRAREAPADGGKSDIIQAQQPIEKVSQTSGRAGGRGI